MEDTSFGPGKKAAVEKKNTRVMWVALAAWLAVSLLVQAFFMGRNPRLDAGAVLVSGAGPILILSALILLVQGVLSWGVFIRLAVGILCVGLGVGELTDLAKRLIWQPVGIAELAVAAGAIFWRIFGRRQLNPAD